MLRSVLDISPAAATKQAQGKPRLSHAEKWELNLAAARQHFEREGHVDVPRKHCETVNGHVIKLGIFIANTRARRASLPTERVAALNALGFRWS